MKTIFRMWPSANISAGFSLLLMLNGSPAPASNDDNRILVALIAGVASLLVAFASGGIALIGSAKQRHYDRDTAERLTKLEQTLIGERAARDAKRDYEYEARKRLYTECEPLIFQLVERGEHAVRRIDDICDQARVLKLSSALRDEYFLRMTVYRLFVPLAICSQMQRSLTFVDISLDQRISAFYEYSKILFATFNDDVALSECRPEIKNYSPDLRRQGLVFGDLSKATDKMTVTTPSGSVGYLTFGEFEATCSTSKEDPSLHAVFSFIASIDVQNRPLIWRMLAAHVILYETMSRIARMRSEPDWPQSTMQLLASVPDEYRRQFPKTRFTDYGELIEDDCFGAAREYILNKLRLHPGVLDVTLLSPQSVHDDGEDPDRRVDSRGPIIRISPPSG